MRQSAFVRFKFIAFAAGLALIAFVVALGRNRIRPTVAEESVPATNDQPSVRTTRANHYQTPLVQGETQEVAAVAFDWRATLTNRLGPPRLPREEVERYLERNHRSAASLLTAGRALQDTNYLNEAATNFPNDPHVQWSVLANNLYPEDRRKWLDMFKGAAPDNAAASYLSARDYFEKGQTDLAVNELVAATGKTGFDNYARESQLDEQELGMTAGRSSVQAMLSSGGWAQELQAAGFKALAQDIRGLETQYVGQGDTASAERLAQMGLALASRMQNGDSARFAICQLSGNAIAAIVLDPLDQSAGYSFLDAETPADVRAGFIAQKKSISDLRQIVLQAIPDMSEAEIVSYLERQRIYGEVNAMRWLQERLSGVDAPVRTK